MFTLIYSSVYTEYPIDTCKTLEDAQRVCKDRLGMRDLKFGQDDAGMLYTAIGDGLGGIAIISLQEVSEP